MTSTSNLPTLVDKLYKSLDNIPNEVFLRQPYGDKWKEFTYKEVMKQALQLVAGMESAELKKGDKVGIYSKNCYQWVIAEASIMLGGFVTVPFYANLAHDALKEVIIKEQLK